MGFPILNHPFWGSPISGNLHKLLVKTCNVRTQRQVGHCLDVFAQIPATAAVAASADAGGDRGTTAEEEEKLKKKKPRAGRKHEVKMIVNKDTYSTMGVFDRIPIPVKSSNFDSTIEEIHGSYQGYLRVAGLEPYSYQKKGGCSSFEPLVTGACHVISPWGSITSSCD